MHPTFFIPNYTLISILLCISLTSHAQKWEIYDSLPASAFVESYDGGYYFATYIYFHKTDVNGKILWRKEIGLPRDLPTVSATVSTKDGGVVLAGITAGADSNNAASLIKLNSCGEVEWSKIYDLNEYLSGTGQIFLMKNGDLVVSYYMADHENKHGNWIFRTDSTGNLKYQSFNTVQDINAIIDKDNNIITSGLIYLPIPNEPGVNILCGGLVKTNPNGHVDWVSTYTIGREIPVFDQATQQTQDGGYLTLGGEVADKQKNTELVLIKTDTSGNIRWTKLIGDTTRYENPIDMVKVNDSLYLVATFSLNKYAKNMHHSAFIKFMIIDTSGKVYKTGSYSNNHWTTVFTNIYPISDGKFMLCGYVNDSNASGYPVNMQALDIKINQNLELDSFATHDTIKYDYKCPGKIPWYGQIYYTGDTIPIQAPSTLGVAIHSLLNTSSLYPNPANDHIVIIASGLSYGAATYSVYDMLGNKVNNYVFSTIDGILNKEISLSGYAKGMYYIEIIQRDKRYTQKFIVE